MDKRPAIRICLGQYLESDPKAYEKISEFCGVGLRAVRDWGGKSFPSGPTLVKLTVFLISEAGHNIEGYEKNSLIFAAMEMIARGKTDAKTINEALGYAEDYEVYRLVFGVNGLSSVKEEKLERFLSPYRRYVEKETTEAERGRNDFLRQFSDLSSAIIDIEPMLDKYLSASAAERRLLREELEQKGLSFFKSSNALYRALEKLNKLCSEKSYHETKHQN